MLFGINSIKSDILLTMKCPCMEIDFSKNLILFSTEKQKQTNIIRALERHGVMKIVTECSGLGELFLPAFYIQDIWDMYRQKQ